jgi:iron complex transport system ATP-binding protein
MKTDTPILETKQLGVKIGNTTVCQELNLRLRRGERLAVLGRNGIGKSTLLSVLAGLREPETGQVLLDGSSYSQLGSRQSARLRGWLGQHQTAAFASTVLEATLVGRHPHITQWEWESEEDLLIVRDALYRVGLVNFDQRDILSLSGGERQRQAIATLLAQAPQLYLLDEPIAHLDLKHQIATLNLFAGSSGGSFITADLSCIMALHEPSLAVRFCSRALLLFGDGSFELGTCKKVVNASSLTRLYGYPLREVSDEGKRWFIPE